eukprot:3475527-Rhodomonas_salina.1
MRGEAGAQTDLLLCVGNGNLPAVQVLRAFTQNEPGFAHGLLRVPDGGKGALVQHLCSKGKLLPGISQDLLGRWGVQVGRGWRRIHP